MDGYIMVLLLHHTFSRVRKVQIVTRSMNNDIDFEDLKSK